MSEFLIFLSTEKTTLLGAFYRQGVKFVCCVIAMIIGINLGKFLRAKKDAKKKEKL